MVRALGAFTHGVQLQFVQQRARLRKGVGRGQLDAQPFGQARTRFQFSRAHKFLVFACLQIQGTKIDQIRVDVNSLPFPPKRLRSLFPLKNGCFGFEIPKCCKKLGDVYCQ
jgi:hypothetical protein